MLKVTYPSKTIPRYWDRDHVTQKAYNNFYVLYRKNLLISLLEDELHSTKMTEEIFHWRSKTNTNVGIRVIE